MKQRYVLPVAVIILLILGAVLWLGFFTKNKPTSRSFRTNAVLPKEIVVKLDKNGFSPKEVTIKTGTAVRWTNVSGDKQTVNSDNYPTNQLHRELNFGVFNNGSSVVYIFTKTGTYGYHNQLNYKQAGKIIVN
jgi:plastocyanin